VKDEHVGGEMENAATETTMIQQGILTEGKAKYN
jgi:hypothetical protein